VRPGSEQARRLKEALQARGLWSQYLEVGIGPDAEVFTKAQPLSAVGTGAQIGIHPASTWNNPEPEVVLVIAPDGRVVGATLGNDVNLRDVEGRSALLLGKAKDNNASCALGPFIRLFDQTFSLDDVRGCEVSVRVEGEDGFSLAELSSMRAISRDVLDLAGQAINRNHQYPDGLVLFTGTLFAPVQDRDAPGLGFTHKEGDVVTIAAAELGALVNQVTSSDRAPPWTFGAGALMRNLAARGLLAGPER
jgi:fumarylacetoacetate (FAA) hydrolase family protein